MLRYQESLNCALQYLPATPPQFHLQNRFLFTTIHNPAQAGTTQSNVNGTRQSPRRIPPSTFGNYFRGPCCVHCFLVRSRSHHIVLLTKNWTANVGALTYLCSEITCTKLPWPRRNRTRRLTTIHVLVRLCHETGNFFHRLQRVNAVGGHAACSHCRTLEIDVRSLSIFVSICSVHSCVFWFHLRARNDTTHALDNIRLLVTLVSDWRTNVSALSSNSAYLCEIHTMNPTILQSSLGSPTHFPCSHTISNWLTKSISTCLDSCVYLVSNTTTLMLTNQSHLRCL